MQAIEESLQLAAKMRNNLSLLETQPFPAQSREDVKSIMRQDINELTQYLQESLAYSHSNQNIISNLTKERDQLLLNRLSEMQKTEATYSSAQVHRDQLAEKNPPSLIFKDHNLMMQQLQDSKANLYSYQNDTLTIQLKTLMKEIASSFDLSKGKRSELDQETVLKFTTISLHVINTMSNNSKRIEKLLQGLVTLADKAQPGKPSRSENQEYSGGARSTSRSRSNQRDGTSPRKNTASSQTQYLKFVKKLQEVMQKNEDLISGKMNTFEFKQNFSIFRQNIVLKKQNIELTEKVKSLNLRMERLYENFRMIMVQKKHDTQSKEKVISELQLSTAQRQFQCFFSKASRIPVQDAQNGRDTESQLKPSAIQSPKNPRDLQEEDDLVIFLRNKVRSLEKELEKVFLQYKKLLEDIKAKTIASDSSFQIELAKEAELSYLRNELIFYKKAQVWSRQEIDLFEAKLNLLPSRLDEGAFLKSLPGNIANQVQYALVTEENSKMIKSVLLKALENLKSERRYKNLEEDLREKKKILVHNVEHLLESDECNSKFIKEFTERMAEELTEFTDGCKGNTQECKKLLKELEDFYGLVRSLQDRPLAPTPSSSLISQDQYM